VAFRVNPRKTGGDKVQGAWVPRWRAGLVCPSCSMSSRMRAMATFIADHLARLPPSDLVVVYLMEQRTPLFQWLVTKFPQTAITGSEYFGPEAEAGTVQQDLRHEDAHALSFGDSSLDLVVSNEVLEHVSDPVKVISECARVLRPGGCLFLTIPFRPYLDQNLVRARVIEGHIEHLTPPIYHGKDFGQHLVFTEFGWELFEQLRGAGFTEVIGKLFWSYEYGHLGQDQVYFQAQK
jgi:SAM-dependent methyltransferase